MNITTNNKRFDTEKEKGGRVVYHCSKCGAANEAFDKTHPTTCSMCGADLMKSEVKRPKVYNK